MLESESVSAMCQFADGLLNNGTSRLLKKNKQTKTFACLQNLDHAS